MSKKALSLIEKNKKTKALHLDLGNCGLFNLPSELKDLTWLESLSLGSLDITWTENRWVTKPTNNKGERNDHLSDISPLSELINLKSLSISDGKIEDFSPVANLAKLETLHLSLQVPAKLPSFQHLKELTALSLSGPATENIAPISDALELEFLQIVNTSVSDIHPLQNLQNLIFLEIGTSPVNDLKPIKHLKSLANLVLTRINAKTIAPLSALKNLRNLHMFDVKISSLSYLSKLPNLYFVAVFSSRVTDLSPICNLPNLEHLIAVSCPIKSIPSLSKLTKLKRLDVSHTLIDDLSPLSNIEELDVLDISNTKVTDLSPIKHLILKGNPVKLSSKSWTGPGIYIENCQLANPPIEIANQGNDAIVEFFRDREAGGVDHLYEAKMLILGEGGAGKTSLLRRLYKPDAPLPAENETTKGIDIYRHDFTLKNGRRFRLNVWDFGGQEIYHATHQFFLTRRSLYLLLDDTRKDHKSVSDPGFKNWLDLIDLFGEHSPTLIFQNEKGGRSKEIDIGGIRSKYDNVKELYSGNLENLSATEKLRLGIEWYASQLGHIGEELPASWVRIRADIESIAVERPHISQQEYFDIYARHMETDKKKALHLSQYLHDLGVFLHFQNHPLLSRIVILQNQWATEAVYRMLDDESVKKKSGRFDQQDCERVWGGCEYSDMHLELLALMENFELCYTLPDVNPKIWLAPQLLSPVKPTALLNWKRPTDLVLNYRYDFMPKGIIGRLMVRLHRFVKDPDIASVNSVLFESESTQAYVELLPNGAEIQIRSRGPERKGFLSVVAAELDAVNNLFLGLRDKVGKWVPCNCTECAITLDPHLFEEKVLRRRIENKRLKVECPRSYTDMEVLALLDGVEISVIPSQQKVEVIAKNERTIEIFLASSAELLADRDEFENYFRQRNDQYREKGLYLKITRWENFQDSMSLTRLQDEYNKAVRKADIFVSLFFTKTGKFTNEEFDIAHQHFKENSRPYIFTYFKNSSVMSAEISPQDFNSLWSFRDKLKSLGHYPTQYDDTEHLKRHFKDQLDMLLDKEFKV